MNLKIRDIAELLKGKIVGDDTLIINGIAKIEEGKEGSISFLSNSRYEPYLYTTVSSAVIVNDDFVPTKEVKTTLIYVPNAYTAFTGILEQYSAALRGSKTGIEQPSYIGANSTIGEEAYRGAFSYIGDNCTIGNDVKIYPQAYIGDNVTIGNNCTIHPGVRIYSGTIIGNNCTIFANTVIGSDGFGFAPQSDGTYKTIPQLGNVVLEDNVSIGSNTTIDCATIGSTIIREGVKLDNLIQIAHNVEIGKNTVIAAQSGVSGSTKIGESCIIAGQVGIVGHIRLPNRTQVGAQAGISKSINKEGLAMTGSPATELRNHMKSLAVFRQLPELEKRVKALENRNND